MIIHLIFAAAAIVYIVGNYLDYKNSEGRQEKNPNYRDEHGYFDEDEFKHGKIKEFAIIAGATILASFGLSFITPHYAYVELIGAAPLILFGVKGMLLSRL